MFENSTFSNERVTFILFGGKIEIVLNWNVHHVHVAYINDVGSK